MSPAPAHLSSVLTTVFRHQPPGALVSERALEALTGTLAPLPRLLSRIFGFECRLGSDDDQTDLFMRVEPEQPGRGILSGSSEIALDDRLLAHPIWARIRTYAREWERSPTPAWHDVRQIWFEFDIPRAPSGVPVPSIFFWHPRAPRLPDGTLPRIPVERHLEITRAAAIPVLGQAPDPGALRGLERALIHLPRHAEVFCVGFMTDRPSSAIRLCLKGLRRGDHAPYLARLGLPGAHQLPALLDEVSGLVDGVQLCFDVSDEIGPRIHLELRCHEHIEPDAPRRWRRLADWVIASGLGRRDKTEALIEWMGEPLRIHLDGERRRRLFRRKLSHVKLAWTADRPPEAKGYFGIWESYAEWDALGPD